MDKKIVAKKSEKSKFEEGLISKKKRDALEFIRGLTIKQIGSVLNDGDVMFNKELDCFFVWENSRLSMYINEKNIPKPPPVPEYVEQEKGDLLRYCKRCGELILDSGFIRLDNGRCFHYNPKCWPTKATVKFKE